MSLKLPKHASRWSETKQKRWLEQRGAVTEEREAAVRGDVVAWYEYLKRVRIAAGTGPIGLLIHFYSGGLETEPFTVGTRRALSLASISPTALQALEPDVLYEFS